MTFNTGRYYFILNDEHVNADKIPHKYITTYLYEERGGWGAQRGFGYIAHICDSIIFVDDNRPILFKDRFKSTGNEITKEEFTFVILSSVELYDVIDDILYNMR